jgi:hypothetical protein
LWSVVASEEYIERLQLVIHHMHGCDSRHVESVPVHEVFRGQTVWRGEVEVFDLNGQDAAALATAVSCGVGAAAVWRGARIRWQDRLFESGQFVADIRFARS